MNRKYDEMYDDELSENFNCLIDEEFNNKYEEENYYNKAIKNVIANSNKKNRRKNNRIIAGATVLTAVVTLMAFAGGFLANDYLNTLNDSKASNLKMQLDGNNLNKGEENSKLDNKENNTYKNNNKENMPIEDVVKLVSPSVVTITVSSQSNIISGGKQNVGTGFIVNKDGTVVTNYHVIENASNVKITFHDGREVNGRIVGTSKKDDLAILKITDKVEMPGIAKLASGDEINAGQEVIAIGNPLGKEFSGSVTKGIISSTSRKISIDGFSRDFIQIDAAINPGNSGGPLINLKGEIIGVNTAKQSGENVEGMGFAVPIKCVRTMIENPENYKNQSGNEKNPYGGNFNGGYPNGGFSGDDYNGEYPNNGAAGGNFSESQPAAEANKAKPAQKPNGN
ncbi:MAG: trypsin-like peptidase domain-containing protein [Clostridium sp.]|uniref:S1C family serine protease n=1 Tax=Clostridium sp. TaxID=1506 RepID=UPI003068954E